MTVNDLARKLGIRAEYSVCLLGTPSVIASAIRRASPQGVRFYNSLDSGTPYHLILFWPQQIEGLVQVFARLQASIIPDGAVWAVIPKKKYALSRGIAFTWEEMQAAGLQTDLVDNKIASIDEQDYGTRFVIRKERRRRPVDREPLHGKQS